MPEPKSSTPTSTALQRPAHGGALNRAIKKYGINQSHWLDLSTGINPVSWPVPDIPVEIYNRLPETDDRLVASAQEYYQNRFLLPVSGSQQAIQLLPSVLSELKLIPSQPSVGLVAPAYAEHEFSWRRFQADIVYLDRTRLTEYLPNLDILLLINPNNPDGYLYQPEQLRKWQQQLQKQNSIMIIDEAFMDCTPRFSLLHGTDFNQATNLIVLRSIGKFFGLAGLRAGFIAAHPEILDYFEYLQGPWPVNNPTRYIVNKVLLDKQWIKQNQLYLHTQSALLQSSLTDFIPIFDAQARLSGTHLFSTVFSSRAEELYELLARQGILTRLLDDRSGVRFGLPGNDQHFQRLNQILSDILLSDPLSGTESNLIST